MIRVALLSPLFESVPPRLYGGTERVVYNLCRGLTESDIEVTLFASGDSSTEGRMIPVIDEALRLRKVPAEDPLAYNFKMLGMVAQRAAAGEFDIIHNHHDYWMLPLSEMTPVPFLSTMHGRMDREGLLPLLNSFPKAHYVSISDDQRKWIPGLKWLRTVPHGIDLETIRFHEKPGKYLAFLGRISPEKRPDWAIEIAKMAGVPLVIAAKIEPGQDRQYFESVIKPKIDGKFIRYIGEISESEKSDFLGNALALVFPIDWPEPFGLVAIESLASGTPVLARPCGSVPEILQDGVTGFISPDIRELARRVRDLPRLDRARCRKWVEDRFSLKRMTEDYIDVYRQLSAARIQRPDRHRWNLVHPLQRTADGNS